MKVRKLSYFLLLIFAAPSYSQDRVSLMHPYEVSPPYQGILQSLSSDPMLIETPQGRKETMTFTDSGKADVLDDSNIVILMDKAQVRRNDAILKGDVIRYDRDKSLMTATGNARLFKQGSLITGPSIIYDTEKSEGKVDEPIFHLNNGGAGRARVGHIVDSNHIRLDEARYSACGCEDQPWYIQAHKVDVYDDENVGIAKNASVFFQDVPFLWTPYLTMPVKAEKKTGFLLPTYGYTSRSGFSVVTPYFINLAPEADMTLAPRYMTKRGVGLDGEFRYAQPDYTGTLTGTYVPHDNDFDGKYYDMSARRWTWSWLHDHKLGKIGDLDFNLKVNWSQASDDDYFRDMKQLSIDQADNSYLDQEVRLGFSGYKYWSGSLTLHKYQALSDREADSLYGQYEKVPELKIRGARYNWNGFDLETTNTLTQFKFPKYPDGFWRDKYREESDLAHGHRQPDGTRFTSYSTISYPMIHSGWYVTPKVGLHYSWYDTDWYDGYKGFEGFRAQSGAQRGTQDRVMPIMSIDSGMTFERPTSFFGHAATQTLEPRVYYLYIPDKDQSDLPVYDTNIAPLSFSTLYSENMYTGGWDRINNANQLTVGLTSRILDENTGFERVAVQLAQRYYFQKPKVTLNNDQKASFDTRSEILGGVRTSLTNDFKTEINFQYDTHNDRLTQTYATMRWNPKRQTSLSLSYRYRRDPFDEEGNQVTSDPRIPGKETVVAAFQWPVTNKLSAVGRFDYSLREHRSTQSILGLEYKGDCCWKARALMQNYAVSREKNNKAVFLQLELTGLGSVGSDPMEVLRKNIPGYEDGSEAPPHISTFERYE